MACLDLMNDGKNEASNVLSARHLYTPSSFMSCCPHSHSKGAKRTRKNNAVLRYLQQMRGVDTTEQLVHLQ